MRTTNASKQTKPASNRKQATTNASKQTKPVTILRACFDVDENGATLYYEIPAEWDTPTATDYKGVTDIIKALNLTSRQAQILRYRLSGKSIHQIADILKIHRKTLQEHMQALRRKYTAYKQAQTASAFLCEYIGKTLQDTTTDGQTDKDGQPVTILRACFRAVNHYIIGERQHDYKRVYVDDVDENGATLYYEIPAEWDTPTATDYKGVTDIIKALNLTSRQAQILRYRLSGKSIHQIADILKIHRKTLQEHMQALRRKYTAYKQATTNASKQTKPRPARS